MVGYVLLFITQLRGCELYRVISSDAIFLQALEIYPNLKERNIPECWSARQVFLPGLDSVISYIRSPGK